MGFSMFGRVYESVGKESADFCIKTKGKVKIKWGNKYIDLISDGKINVDADFIMKATDKDSIGNKDGIYVTDDGSVYLKIGDNIIPLYGDESSSDYVAYTLQEGKTGEQMENAQRNIGILCDTVSSLQSLGIRNGIAYVSEEQAIYLIKNGIPERLEFKIPNPITDPLLVQVTNAAYALMLSGYYSESGTQLLIGSLENYIRIYAEDDAKYIDASDKVVVTINNTPIITITGSNMTVNQNLEVVDGKELITNIIKSHNGTEEDGYLLEEKNGESWLYVDNIVVRNGLDETVEVEYGQLISMIEDGELEAGTEYTIIDFQNEWDLIGNREEDDIVYDGNEDDEGNLVDAVITDCKFQNVFKLIVTATGPNEISSYARFKDHPEWDVLYDVTYNDSFGETVDEEGNDIEVSAKGRITYLRDEYGNEANYDFKHLRFNYDGKLMFTFGGEEMGTSGVISDGSITGKFRNNKIHCDFDNLKRESIKEDFSTLSYTLGGDVIIRIIGDEVTDNSFGNITGLFLVDTRICKGNTISTESVKDVKIESDFKQNQFLGGEIVKLESEGDIVNTVATFDIMEQEFKGAKACIIKGNLQNCTFDAELITTTFHSDLSGQAFPAADYPYLYNEKVVDVYMNEGELRHICMPDTVFQGMIVMYDGRKPIPTGWALCDGSNGTPNLLDKFVKFSSNFGEEGGEADGMIKYTNLPPGPFSTEYAGGHSYERVTSCDLGVASGGEKKFVTAVNTSDTTIPDHTHLLYLHRGTQTKFEPSYMTVIPIMYVGG